jgi:HEAT repeat protein
VRLPARPDLLLCLLLVAGCGARVVAPAGPVPLPSVHLTETDVDELAALLHMEDSRALDTALVAGLIARGSPEVRARAALAAGRIGTPAATPLLLRAIVDADAGVRTRAAFALGLHADSTAAVLTELTRVALHDLTAPAIEAVGALARIGGAPARAVIDSVLTQPRHHAALRDEALIVAWRLPRDSATTARIATFTAHADAEARWRAAYSLARNGSPAAVPVLVELLTDPDARVRAHAARGLRASHADSAGARDRALDALLLAARDTHPHVRINALRLLPGYREPVRTTPALMALLADADANVAVAAAQALGEARDQAAATTLRAVAMRSAHSDGLRTAALASLAGVDAAMAAALALAWADSTEAARWVLRQHAARTLTLASWTRVAAPLEKLARDPHHLVAAEALHAIRAVADTMSQARRIFLEQLAAPHPLVRAAAVRGIARSAGPADLDLLLHAWDHARGDSGREVALAVLEGLHRIAQDGTPVDRAFYLRFGDHGAPADLQVYRAMVERVGPPPRHWSPPTDRPAVRPVDFYRDIVRTYVAPVLAGGESPRVLISTPHGDDRPRTGRGRRATHRAQLRVARRTRVLHRDALAPRRAELRHSGWRPSRGRKWRSGVFDTR